MVIGWLVILFNTSFGCEADIIQVELINAMGTETILILGLSIRTKGRTYRQ